MSVRFSSSIDNNMPPPPSRRQNNDGFESGGSNKNLSSSWVRRQTERRASHNYSSFNTNCNNNNDNSLNNNCDERFSNSRHNNNNSNNYSRRNNQNNGRSSSSSSNINNGHNASFCRPRRNNNNHNSRYNNSNDFDCDGSTTVSNMTNNSSSFASSSMRTRGNSVSTAPTSPYPTSAITINSTHHGRLRRDQRHIHKRQLQAAMKYGDWEPGHRPGTSKYTHDGITFIVNDATRAEITSFVSALDLPCKKITDLDRQTHEQSKHEFQTNLLNFCTSHSVLLIDVSGSMRNSDVQGARSRLSAVWLALAEDFVRQRIESINVGQRDAVSVILMEETPKLLIDKVPTDWILYNQFLMYYKTGEIRARGHSPYGPSLRMAQEILMHETSSNCALMLMLLSDGRPSDPKLLNQTWEEGTNAINRVVETIASKLGNRLTFHAIGMGSVNYRGRNNEFETLQSMCEAAKPYETQSNLSLPSLTGASIAAAMSSVATSITTAQTSLASTGPTSIIRRVRNVERENRNIMPCLTEVVEEDDFDIYMGSSKVVRMIFDPSEPNCNTKMVELENDDAHGVAMHKKPFGEGTERFAYQFFEVDEDGFSVVGEPMVAKESRFSNEEHNAERFARRFCRIQYQASKAAKAFNNRLEQIKSLDPDTARVNIVPCSIYKLFGENGDSKTIIVEPRLFGNFKKWNSNNGWFRKSPKKKELQAEIPKMCIKQEDTIKEEEEDHEDEDDAEVVKMEDENEDADDGSSLFDGADEDFDLFVVDTEPDKGVEQKEGETEAEQDESPSNKGERIFFTHNDVAQAFSHFSFTFSARRMLICDLQGVYDKPNRQLHLTDPVIHTHDDNDDKNNSRHNKGSSTRRKYGRTDRGIKGIEDFLHSHECNGLCKYVIKGFLHAKTPNSNNNSV